MSKVLCNFCLVFLSIIFIACSKNDIDITEENFDNNTTEETSDNNIDIEKIVDLINIIRSKGTTCGSTYYPPVEAIIWNNKLESAAIKHCKDMMDNNFFSHTSFNGDSYIQRISDAGYVYSSIGENIAKGYSSEEAVVNGWLTSQGHCANIMNPKYSEMGVGRVGDYWTQDFGKPKE